MCIEKKRKVDAEFSHAIGGKEERSGHHEVVLHLLIIIIISDVVIVFVKHIICHEPAATRSVPGRLFVQNWHHGKSE